MSNMLYEKTSYGADVNILKRPPFEGIAITLDFTDVVGDVVKAGTPISAAGVAANTSSAVGILLHDVYKERPQGTILKKAYIDLAKAEANSGLTIAAAVKSALPMIVFE